MQQQERNFVIPANLLQVAADYLSNRPYREVAGIIQQMANLKPIEPAECASPPDWAPSEIPKRSL